MSALWSQLSTTQVVQSVYSVEEWRYGVRFVRALSTLHLPYIAIRMKTLINSIGTLFELQRYESFKGTLSEHHVYFSNTP
jgi:hypothetical protein